MGKVKEKTKAYIVCVRCEENNWDNPKFWGCPRGSCDAETKGVIQTIKTLKLS